MYFFIVKIIVFTVSLPNICVKIIFTQSLELNIRIWCAEDGSRTPPAHPIPILDLTEEFIRINNVCEEAAQAVNEYVAKMNDVGVFLEPLGVAPTEL